MFSTNSVTVLVIDSKYIIDMGLMKSNCIENAFIRYEYFIHSCFLKILLNFLIPVERIITLKYCPCSVLKRFIFLGCAENILMAGTRSVLTATHRWSLSRYTRRIAIVRNSNWVRRKRFWLPTRLCCWRLILLLWNSPLNRLKSKKKKKKEFRLDKIIQTGCVDRMWLF